MRGDSPYADVELAESCGCCNLSQGSHARGCHGQCHGGVMVSR
jgi:hypothetical protein